MFLCQRCCGLKREKTSVNDAGPSTARSWKEDPALPCPPLRMEGGREKKRYFLPLGTVTVVVAIELLPDASVDVTVIV